MSIEIEVFGTEKGRELKRKRRRKKRGRKERERGGRSEGKYLKREIERGHWG